MIQTKTMATVLLLLLAIATVGAIETVLTQQAHAQIFCTNKGGHTSPGPCTGNTTHNHKQPIGF